MVSLHVVMLRHKGIHVYHSWDVGIYATPATVWNILNDPIEPYLRVTVRIVEAYLASIDVWVVYMLGSGLPKRVVTNAMYHQCIICTRVRQVKKEILFQHSNQIPPIIPTRLAQQKSAHGRAYIEDTWMYMWTYMYARTCVHMHAGIASCRAGKVKVAKS